MTRISSTDMAFEGIRLAREQPRAILVWAGVFFLFSLLTTGLLVTLAGEAMTELTAASSTARTPEEMLALLAELAPAYLAVMLVSVVVYGLLYAALYRAVLRPAEGGAGFLRFGGDELRQIGVLFLYYLAIGAIYVVGVFLASLLGAMLGAAAGEGAGRLVTFLLMVGVLCATLLAAVRLSLAGPLTFAAGRVRLLQSLSMTRGRFWPLFGGYLLAGAIALVVWVLALVIFVALAALLGGGVQAAGRMFHPDFSSLGSYFTPLTVLYLLFVSLLYALTLALSGGAAAEAYRQIQGAGPDGSIDSAAL